MRCIVPLVFVAALSANASSAAEVPDQPEAILKAVEARMKTVASFSAKCRRTDIHPLTKKETIFSGEVAWQRPNKAKLALTHPDDVGKKDADKTRFERFIADGTHIYEYSPREKLIIRHDQPKDADANVLFAFLKGMKADDLKTRFDIQLAPANEKTKDWYAFVRFYPKNAADLQDFKVAEVAVWIKNPNPEGQPDLTHVPCQVRYVQPNGSEVKYWLSDLQPNVRLPESTFKPFGIKGYDVKVAGAAPALPKK